MCFSLQRRANFPQPKVPKCSDREVFCAFWVANVLLATMACHFSTSKLPKVSQDRQFFCILTANVLRATAAGLFSASQLPKAVRRWGVLWLENALRATAAYNFFVCSEQLPPHPPLLASLLFDPADAQIIEKTQHFATFLTFRACRSSFYWLSRNCIFFLLTLLLFSAFHLRALLLCSAFSTVHIVGS